MPTGLRTLLSLVVLALLVVVVGGWGWTMLTEPFPQKADAPVCDAVDVKAGDHVFPAQVTVSVLNASKREGLAGRTMASLIEDGFVAGTSGNAAKRSGVSTVQIWTSDPQSPAVELVAAWLPGAKVVRRTSTEPGVVVVLGDKFAGTGNGPKSVTAQADATICSPTLS